MTKAGRKRTTLTNTDKLMVETFGSVRAACSSIGISEPTYKVWLNDPSKFLQKIGIIAYRSGLSYEEIIETVHSDIKR